jgi:TolB-like protein
MSSIIEGYNYDIFISYRQKDNKGESWVSEFVEALKTELESTFKEEISVYFDINPHDGLLETHDVDASLKEKLKCLIFIPVISRTYCDPKSFAWEHEFKAFIDQASNDKFGLKVKLPSGNVGSRVLPVRIHELEPADQDMVEKELGGFLRGIEFIYKEPGVNRPLTHSDDEKKNLAKTQYRNQINKTANAIKEIISGLITEEPSDEKKINETLAPEKEGKKKISLLKLSSGYRKTKLFYAILSILILLALAGIIIYPRFHNADPFRKIRTPDGRIPIAVMPFQNLSNDSTLNYLREWIPECVTSYLSNYPEDFQMRQPENIYNVIRSEGITNYASITPSVGKSISRKLDANIFISGRMVKSSTGIIVDEKIINSKTEEVLQSFKKEGNIEGINLIIDTLSQKIRDYLLIKKMKNQLRPDIQRYVSTNSPEALKHYILGQQANTTLDWEKALGEFRNAVKTDSNFIEAYLRLISAYINKNLTDSAKIYCLRLYSRKDKMSELYSLQTEFVYSSLFKTPYDCIKCLNRLLEIDDQQPRVYYQLGLMLYLRLKEPDKAIPEFEKSLAIYDKWGTKPP